MRTKKEKNRKVNLMINKAMNLDRPKNQIPISENNKIPPGYISRSDLTRKYRHNIAVRDSSLQIFGQPNEEHHQKNQDS